MTDLSQLFLLESTEEALESEEERNDQINSSEIPDNLWSIIPENGQFIVNIMKFCEYKTRSSILKLRERDELQKMLLYVIKNEELFADEEERSSIFGRFKKKPHLLSIPPGIETAFKEFLMAVDNLVKPAKSKVRNVARNMSSISTNISTTPEAFRKSTKIKPTAQELTEKAKKYLLKELLKSDTRMSTEDINRAFEISDSGHSFRFKCHKVGCKETCVIPYNEKTKDPTMSNAYRHMKSCLLGVKRGGKEKSNKSISRSICFTQSSTNFFKAKKPSSSSSALSSRSTLSNCSSNTIDLTERVFSPRHEDDTDFSKNGVETLMTPPKNLHLPAGLPDVEDVSGH